MAYSKTLNLKIFEFENHFVLLSEQIYNVPLTTPKMQNTYISNIHHIEKYDYKFLSTSFTTLVKNLQHIDI